MTYILSNNTASTGSCIFCDKVTCEIDRRELILMRGTATFMMLNLYPYNNGHLLVAPYQHCATLEDLPGETLNEMMALAIKGLASVRHALHPQGFNLGINLGKVAGAGVADHVHMHIVPRWGADTNYITVTGDTRVIPEALEATYDHLLAAMHALGYV